MVHQPSIVHLVRPRTTVTQDTNHRPAHAQKPSQRSFVVLSLCGACMFLLILSACLITSLVLVGKSLAEQNDNNNTTSDFSVTSSVNALYAATPIRHIKNRLLINDQDDNNGPTLNGTHKMTGSTKIVSKVLDQLGWRLPQAIRPKRYELQLAPDFATKRFEGKVRIELEVSQPMQFIAIHSNQLNITGTQLDSLKNGGSVSIANAFDYPKFQYWVTEPVERLAAGDYVLTLKFNGSLTDSIVGFYQSSYIAADRKTVRYMATSKFEPTYARQSFPCFDEPAMKAPFKISLVRPLGDNYIALSNMNEESVEELPGQNKALVHFAESVPMSTYLTVFIVSDFRFKQLTVNAGGIGNDFILRAFATPAQLEKVTFALETAKTITEYYIQYFKEEYPLPKLDMAAIPDFVSGAMETWGLVTYRETSLLYDPAISSTVNRRRVAQVVAHELAHMWFGNLVTMAWWDELWLNEGFASYIEFKGLNASQPEWNIMDQFIFTPQGVMGLDATLASHPIVQTAENPDQITELFDSITYSKGSSVIRMLEDFVGSDVFSLGVSNYLKNFKYRTAVTDDLLHELEQVQTENLDIKYVISTWTKQMGYPVVNVERVSGNQYKLTQKRFLSNPENEKVVVNDSEFNYRWYIPITYTTDNAPMQRVWFKNDDIEITLPDVGPHRWIKLNRDQIGYYRVNYPKDMWQTLTDALIENVNQFSISDRGHLLNDVFSLAEATQVEYATALELTRYLNDENAYVPWSVASSKINELKNKLYYTEHYSKYAVFGRSIILAPYTRTSWTVGNDQLENHQRITILSLACSMGIQQCIDQAGAEFTRWLDNPDVRPHPDLRELVYYYGMLSAGNEERWFKMWNVFKAESDAQEKAKLMYGLTAIQVPWILKRFVDLAEDESNVRSQDYFTALQQIAGNRIGESIVWDYVRENWPKLVARFGINERYLGRLIPSITGRFSTEMRLQEIREFFAKYPEAGAGAAARQQALDQVQNNIKWLENNAKNIGDWLDANY